MGDCLVCGALPDPAHQAGGVHAGGNRGHLGAWDQAGSGAHHCGPHLSWSRQLRGHWHVCGVRPGGQGDGRPRGHRVFHHRCCGIHIIRYVCREGQPAARFLTPHSWRVSITIFIYFMCCAGVWRPEDNLCESVLCYHRGSGETHADSMTGRHPSL